VFTACGGGGGGGSSDKPVAGGTFTLTDIPSDFDGRYAYLLGYVGNNELVGAQNINMETGKATGVPISNGRVSLPMWIIKGNGVEKYSGNHTSVEIEIYGFDYDVGEYADIPNTQGGVYYESVTFSNGSATRSVNQADDGFWTD
jgi:hypothetical protein